MPIFLTLHIRLLACTTSKRGHRHLVLPWPIKTSLGFFKAQQIKLQIGFKDQHYFYIPAELQLQKQSSLSS